jgi:hypothetical protein
VTPLQLYSIRNLKYVANETFMQQLKCRGPSSLDSMESGKLKLMFPYFASTFIWHSLAVMDFINGKNYAVPVEKVRSLHF